MSGYCNTQGCQDPILKAQLSPHSKEQGKWLPPDLSQHSKHYKAAETVSQRATLKRGAKQSWPIFILSGAALALLVTWRSLDYLDVILVECKQALP